MTFREALEHLERGDRVRRPKWSPDAFLISWDGRTYFGEPYNMPFSYIGDMLSDDWELHEPKS